MRTLLTVALPTGCHIKISYSDPPPDEDLKNLTQPLVLYRIKQGIEPLS